MEPIKTIKIQSPKTIHTCIHCGHAFRGKLCNECGEKTFHPKQLSVHHFVHQVIDLFTHFENKVLKTAWLTVRRPGFVTAENLRGVRVPYAKPVQLFIVVNLCFYLLVSYLKRTDYVPSAFDNGGSYISARPGLGWVEPLDVAIMNSIDTLRTRKLATYTVPAKSGVSYKIFTEGKGGDSAVAYRMLAEERRQQAFFTIYDQKVSFFSKTLIFLLIPVFALCFYVIFRRQLVYYGAALILATHFLVFNLLFYMIMSAINHLPTEWLGTGPWSGVIFKSTEALLYNDWMAPFSKVVFGIYGGYEALHVLALGGWLFLAFRRLFGLPVWKNLLVSYILARLVFILIFGLYKKFLIAFTIWNL